METKPTANDLAAAYIRIRRALEIKEEEHKKATEKLKEHLETIGAELLDICREQDADTIKTPSGTVSRRVSTKYWASDWDAMREFIKENDAFELYEQRLNNTNVKKFLEENPGKYPIGLQSDRRYAVSVRKPTGKAANKDDNE